MPSLFEEMQEARRRGELALPEEEAGPPVEVTFTASAIPGASICEACWVLVDSRVTAAHAWEVHGVMV